MDIDTTKLRELLNLLRDMGVTEFEAAGVSLKIAPVTKVAESSTRGALEEFAQKNPGLASAVGKLPAGYQQMFRYTPEQK